MKLFLILFFFGCIFNGCSQENRGPGLSFDLFKNTPNWDLAKAVKQEDVPEIRRLIRDNKINVNLQEQKYGQTLLLLAVGNDKPVSTKALLEEGARQDIVNFLKEAPIHVATESVTLNKHSKEILGILLQAGADPNLELVRQDRPGEDYYKYVPLFGAIEDTACTRLLLDYGGNIYYNNGKGYPIWNMMFAFDYPFSQNIFVALDIIVQRKMPIPNPITYKIVNKEPIDALVLINNFKVHDDAAKIEAKQRIITYLKSIDFPNNGVYKGK